MEKHYVEFRYPGSLFTDISIEEIAERDPSKIKATKSCFGYRLFDRIEGEINGVKVSSKPLNYSGVYYFGIVKTLEDIKKEMPGSNLEYNMKTNNWDKVVKTRCGNYQPFTIEDVIISKK